MVNCQPSVISTQQQAARTKKEQTSSHPSDALCIPLPLQIQTAESTEDCGRGGAQGVRLRGRFKTGQTRADFRTDFIPIVDVGVGGDWL